jgi:hypothetical protein
LPIFMSFSGFRGLRRGMTGVVLPRVFEKLHSKHESDCD